MEAVTQEEIKFLATFDIGPCVDGTMAHHFVFPINHTVWTIGACKRGCGELRAAQNYVEPRSWTEWNSGIYQRIAYKREHDYNLAG